MVTIVVKASGEMEPLDLNKVRRSCEQVEASPETIEKVIQAVSDFAYDGITTQKIYRKVRSVLKKYARYAEARFRLKEAMIKMGPSGFPFETYINEVLKNYGYSTRIRTILKGVCANHEIDIIAEESSSKSEKYLVECKYHNAFGIYTGLKETLCTYARLLDLQEGYMKGVCENLDKAWLVTNTKISREAVKYGECKGIKLLGWNHPLDNGLEQLIQEKDLYPVTVLDFVDRDSLNKLSKTGIMLMKNLEILSIKKLSEITEISLNKLEQIHSDLIKMKKSY
jgi:hypothetical protein